MLRRPPHPLAAVLLGAPLVAQAPAGTRVDLAGVARVTVPEGTRYFTRAEAEAAFRHPLLATSAPWIGVFAPASEGEPPWLVRVEYHPVGHVVVGPHEQMADGALYRALASEVEADNARRIAEGFPAWTPATAREVADVFTGDFRPGPAGSFRLDLSVGPASGLLTAGIRFTRDGYLRWISGPLPPPPLEVNRPERALAALEALSVAPEARYAAWRKGERLAGSAVAASLGIRTAQPSPVRQGLARLGMVLLGLLAVAAPFIRFHLARRLRRRLAR